MRCRRSNKTAKPSTVLLVKAGLALASSVVGLGLAFAVGKTNWSSEEESEGFRLLQESGTPECSSSLWPVRNGSFETKGIALCKGSEGGVVLAVLLMIYSFWALAIMVDEGFVTVLDWIVQELEISEDVAGATFMAAGGSAPEFFTNLFSTFESTATGFGTIVGSAVFNILFVISMSAFFSRPREEVVRRRELRERGIVVKEPWKFEPLPLTWWPLLRDSFFYITGLSLLAIFYFCITPFSAACPSGQGFIMWYESMLLFFLYVGYCLIMLVQEPIKHWVEEKFPNMVPHQQRKEKPAGEVATVTPSNSNPAYWDVESNEDETESRASMSRNSVENKRVSMLRRRASVSFNPEDVANKRVSFNAMGRRGLLVNEDLGRPKPQPLDEIGEETDQGEKDAEKGEETEGSSDKKAEGEEEGEGEAIDIVEPRMRPMNWKGDPDRKDDKLYRIRTAVLYALVAPIVATKATIVFNYDSLNRIEDKVRRRLAGTYAFTMSLVWIAFYTWLMVYSAEAMAATIGIPEVILGFTILAAGTSTPDMLSSVFVAQLGYGDMAVSSSIGSNIFDILVGLPIPWFLKIVVTGEPVAVPTGSIGFSLAVIIAMMVSLVGIIIHQEWKLTKQSAWAMLILYFVFIISICIAELA